MSSTFNVNRAEGYERLMGRWSRLLAGPFIEFTGIEDGDRIIDVGCGTGSLTFALPQAADIAAVEAVDLSPVFVEEATRRNSDARIHISQADACDLPFGDKGYDRALSLLVLHFIPEPEKAVAEMRRVVRSGGTVSAAVWDHLGGLPSMRMMWDTVATTGRSASEARARYLWQPMTQPGELKRCFVEAGLLDVEDGSLVIRMEYASFEDYWGPIATGEGPLGKYVSSLAADEQVAIDAAVRSAYEGGRPDGPRSFAAVAWACRGIVP